jgi:hypothetical protein
MNFGYVKPLIQLVVQKGIATSFSRTKYRAVENQHRCQRFFTFKAPIAMIAMGDSLLGLDQARLNPRQIRETAKVAT